MGIGERVVNYDGLGHSTEEVCLSYKKEWNAICPKCDEKLTHADYTCDNCGKGKIKVFASSYDIFSFGCEKCDHPVGLMKCYKCGATLHSKVVKTAGCFIATAVFGYESPVTQFLRMIRDNVIIQIPGGRKFIFWYYEKSQLLLARSHPQKTKPGRVDTAHQKRL